MGLLDRRIGLVMGVANERSIAWSITQALWQEGAELAFTHLPTPSSRRRIVRLVEPHQPPVVLPCDVQRDEDIAKVFAAVKETYGRLDLLVHSIAFAPPQELKKPYLEMSRQGWHLAMDISAYSLVAVCRAAAPLMPPGSAVVTISYLGGERVIPETNGVMVVSREDPSMTPAGMTFSTLAGMAGGGLQTPGIMGVGKFYLTSPRFISADGGFKRVVWMSSFLKQTMAEEFKAVCEREGDPDLMDKIADETVCTDVEGLLQFLEEKGHPALSMPPIF
ncbi:MAG TPA: SDR family oxidoreductase [Planctomycetaceae bacterium]|nr:SDR family oxidoreductase [Planctomycetaceae bacterium]